MKTLLAYIILFSSYLSTFGQSYFDRSYGTCKTDIGYCAQELQNREIILITTYCSDDFSEKLQIVKTDSSGNLIWARRILNDRFSYSFSLKKYKDNLILLSNYCEPESYWKPIIIEFDTSGNILRSRIFNSGTVTSFDITKDHGFIITGTAKNGGILVTKVDSSFNIEWAKEFFGYFGSQNEGQNIIQTADNGFVLVGYVENGTSLDYQPAIIRFDQFGNVKWNYYYPVIGNYHWYHKTYHISKIIETKDNGFFISGTYACPGINWTPFIAKIDTSGNIKMIRTYEFPSNTYLIDMKIYDENSLMLLGNSTFDTDYYSIFVMKSDLDGDIIWNKKFYNEHEQTANSFFIGNDKCLIISGKTNNGYGSTEGRYSDIYLLKIDSSGNSNCSSDSYDIKTIDTINFLSINSLYSDFNTIVSNDIILTDSIVNLSLDSTDCEFTGIYKIKSKISFVNIFPNPVTDRRLFIKFTESYSNLKYKLDIFNSLGEIIYTEEIFSSIENKMVYLNDLINGIYYVRISNTDFTNSKKIIVQIK
jgi:hypothetical protein